MSRRACSTIERSTSRPMRPKPLMATRTVMGSKPPNSGARVLQGEGVQVNPSARSTSASACYRPDLPRRLAGSGAGGVDVGGAGQGDAHAAAFEAFGLAEQAQVRARHAQRLGN